MKRWFSGFALIGLVVSLSVLLLMRAHVKLIPMVVASVYPTILIVLSGAFGLSIRLLVGISVLLNALIYGVIGYLTGLSLGKWRQPAR